MPKKTIANPKKLVTPYELDQLREVMNISVSHASTALSQLIKRRVMIEVPEVYIENVENVSKVMGGEKEIVTAILLKVYGDASGILTFLFPHTDQGGDIVKVINLITNEKKKDKKVLGEFDISVLKEVGNILAGASLTAFSKFLDVSIMQSVSEGATDMLGSIVNSLMAELGKKSNVALIFKVRFIIEKENINLDLYYFIDPTTSTKILKATKKKFKNVAK